jgi:hypothetical protein
LAVLHDQFAGRAPGFRGGFNHVVTINVVRDKPCIDPVLRPFAMRPSAASPARLHTKRAQTPI